MASEGTAKAPQCQCPRLRAVGAAVYLTPHALMSDRLHELDPTSAIFSALGSFWWRLLAFFACAWLAHYVGTNAYTAGGFFRDVWQNGPGAILDQERLNPILVPLGWLWALLSGCSNPLGLVQLFILATAFLFVRLSEDRFFHGFGIVLLTQPIHSFCVSLQDHGRLDGLDLGIGLVILLTWETLVGGLYWWCWRQME